MAIFWSACFVPKGVSQKKMQDLNVTIASVTTLPQVGAALELSFAVTNPHKKSQKFCRYMTPIEGFYGDILVVTDVAGHRVAYAGIKKKRGAPQPSDDIHLGEGETKSATFDLMEAYPIVAPGNYTVQFKGSKYMNKLPDSNVLLIAVRAGSN
jgi:hypothetical protein